MSITGLSTVEYDELFLYNQTPNKLLQLSSDNEVVSSEYSLDDYYTKPQVDGKLLLKADKTYVDDELLKKANKTYVDDELAKKANLIYVNEQLATKSNKTYVDDELAKKVGKDETNSFTGINNFNNTVKLNSQTSFKILYLDGNKNISTTGSYAITEMATIDYVNTEVDGRVSLNQFNETLTNINTNFADMSGDIVEIQNTLNQKANANDVYSITNADSTFAKKTDLNGYVTTGTLIATTTASTAVNLAFLGAATGTIQASVAGAIAAASGYEQINDAGENLIQTNAILATVGGLITIGVSAGISALLANGQQFEGVTQAQAVKLPNQEANRLLYVNDSNMLVSAPIALGTALEANRLLYVNDSNMLVSSPIAIGTALEANRMLFVNNSNMLVSAPIAIGTALGVETSSFDGKIGLNVSSFSNDTDLEINSFNQYTKLVLYNECEQESKCDISIEFIKGNRNFSEGLFNDWRISSNVTQHHLLFQVGSSGVTSDILKLGNNEITMYKPLTVNNINLTGSVSGITKTMVGLSNVDNTTDLGKPISTLTQTALNLKANLASPTFTGTVSGITKAMVGLSNVDNTTDLGKPISTLTQTALDLKANLASPTFTGTVSGITKAMVGLGNVDNTTDLGKPISTLTQTAINTKANLNYDSYRAIIRHYPLVWQNVSQQAITDPLTLINNTINALNSSDGNWASIYYLPPADGSIPNGQPFYFRHNAGLTSTINTARTNLTSNYSLPGGYQNLIVIFVYNSNLSLYEFYGEIKINSIPTSNEFNSRANSFTLPSNRTAGVLVSNGTGSTSWSTNYTTTTDLNSALALKANLASPTFTGTVSGITKAMVGLSNVDNTTDIGKPISTLTQTALDLKANLASPTFTGTVSGITKAMVGLPNVDNTTDLAKPISTSTQTALDLKANLASPTFTGTVSGITKAMVGLSNVDNTTDLAKPISTSTQTALDLKANLAIANTYTALNTFNAGINSGGNINLVSSSGNSEIKILTLQNNMTSKLSLKEFSDNFGFELVYTGSTNIGSIQRFNNTGTTVMDWDCVTGYTKLYSTTEFLNGIRNINGTTGAPSYSFASSTNSGLTHGGTNMRLTYNGGQSQLYLEPNNIQFVLDTNLIGMRLEASRVSIGAGAGANVNATGGIAIGYQAGFEYTPSTVTFTPIAIGYEAGKTNQNNYAVAIGRDAGKTNQGAYSIAIGYGAGQTNQAVRSIVLNANSVPLNNTIADAFVVRPIRNVGGGSALTYNTSTGEIVTVASSLRYKKNVVYKDIQYNDILKFKCVEYDLKDTDTHFNVGYIAEDLAEINEDFINRDAENRPDSLQQYNMLVYTIELCKAQQKQIDELTAKVESLKSENLRLKKIEDFLSFKFGEIF